MKGSTCQGILGLVSSKSEVPKLNRAVPKKQGESELYSQWMLEDEYKQKVFFFISASLIKDQRIFFFSVYFTEKGSSDFTESCISIAILRTITVAVIPFVDLIQMSAIFPPLTFIIWLTLIPIRERDSFPVGLQHPISF